MNVRIALLFGVAALAFGAAAAPALRGGAPQSEAAQTGAAVELRGGPPGRAGDLAAEVEALRREVAELRALGATPLGALANLKIPDQMQLCGRALPLDRVAVREALAYELVLSVGKPTMPLLWMRRAPAQLPRIEARLKQFGLPDDLKYLAMIESDLRWNAESPAGALGLWQFMRPTGQRYGLRADAAVDERLDPDASTDAAMSYLGTLHRQFGDWFLALAAYNYGENGVARAIQEQGKRDYFELYLPYETRRYVPRLAAAKLVYERPEDYGLFRMDPLRVLTYREVRIDVPKGGGDLVAIARARGLDYADLRIHNPQIKNSRLPQGTYRLRVPAS